MSKFIEALTALDTGETSPLYPNIQIDINEISKSDCINYPRKRYIIRSQWSAGIDCTPEQLSELIKIVKKQLQQEVYGDFIELIIQMEQALHQNNSEIGLQILNKMKKEAFPV